MGDGCPKFVLSQEKMGILKFSTKKVDAFASKNFLSKAQVVLESLKISDLWEINSRCPTIGLGVFIRSTQDFEYVLSWFWDPC